MAPLLTPPQAPGSRELPYNPIDTVMRSPEHARRTILGVLESYNSNYDALAEAVQNSMDALEDASLNKLPGPFLIDITIDLLANAISILDTGIGMTQDQVCEAFAPSATFKDAVASAANAMIKKRGEKHPYRGYKGVGLTFLAYGTDDVQIQSRQNGHIVKGRMRLGRKWAESKNNLAPILESDVTASPLDKHKRGTNIRIQFSSDTKPAILSSLGTSIELWEAIIRTRTAVGQVLIGRESLTPIKVHLNVIGKDGLKQEKDLEAEFYYPHFAQRNPSFRFLDVTQYYAEHPGIADHAPEARRQDAVFIRWNDAQITEHLSKTNQDEFHAELNEFRPHLYAFRPYHAPVWSEINKAITKQIRTHYFAPGLVIAVDRQRMADIFRVQASRSDLLAQNIFVLVHFDKAKPDQGRKTLQSKVMDLAQIVADEAVQYLLKQSNLLKPAGEKTTAAQRAVEKNHEDWVDNVKAHAKANPLSIAPVSYASTPITEQDVVGLFNQFTALGLFPGMKILATSGAHTYDCYVQFKFSEDMNRLRYQSIGNTPLGLSTDILGPEDTEFLTKGLTLEFKNNLEGLIDDIESPAKKKAFHHIDICVCWGTVESQHRSYQLDTITESNLHERRYPGVTHVLRKDGESHVIQVVMLEDISKRISAGQIVLPTVDR